MSDTVPLCSTDAHACLMTHARCDTLAFSRPFPCPRQVPRHLRQSRVVCFAGALFAATPCVTHSPGSRGTAPSPGTRSAVTAVTHRVANTPSAVGLPSASNRRCRVLRTAARA